MKKTLLLVALTAFGFSINAQNTKCTTMSNWERVKEKDPNAELRMQQLEIKTQEWIEQNKGQKKSGAVITIPVVVHVVYNLTVENISVAQIQSQIDVLNADFRLLNSDSLQTSHAFYSNTADCEIEFCLAKQDPSGNATTGITRTFTDSTSFAGVGNEKLTAMGGKDNWDPTKYLNLWVCNLSGSTLGYAAFPSDLSTSPAEDGVVIRHQAFGTLGTVASPNDLGRTGTHEVGHWLNLWHIWGDDCGDDCAVVTGSCSGDDSVSDTPNQECCNYDCPTFPLVSCSNGPNGDMYMNYMDYVDDACMVMFTDGQKSRMNAVFSADRAGILTSIGCMTTGIEGLNNQTIDVKLIPNPSNGQFFIDLQSDVVTDINIRVVNVLGEVVYQFTKQNISSLDNYKVDLNNEANGIYFVNITAGNHTINKKLIIE